MKAVKEIMELTDEEIQNITTILATKKGMLKRNIYVVVTALAQLFDGKQAKASHIGMDFAKSFYDVVEALDLKLVEHGNKEEYIAMQTHEYAVSIEGGSPYTFRELLDICEISYTEDQLTYRA